MVRKKVIVSEQEMTEAKKIFKQLVELNRSEMYQSFEVLPEALGQAILVISNRLELYTSDIK